MKTRNETGRSLERFPKDSFPPSVTFLQTNLGVGVRGSDIFLFVIYISLCVGTSYHVSWGFGTNGLKLLEPFSPTLDLCSKIGNNVP